MERTDARRGGVDELPVLEDAQQRALRRAALVLEDEAQAGGVDHREGVVLVRRRHAAQGLGGIFARLQHDRPCAQGHAVAEGQVALVGQRGEQLHEVGGSDREVELRVRRVVDVPVEGVLDVQRLEREADLRRIGELDGARSERLHLVVEPGHAYENVAITLTDRTSAVTGTVTNSRQEPVDQHVVILFPEGSALRVPQSRRIQVARTGPDGRFAFRSLPAGDYRLAVVLDHQTGREFNAEFLEALVPASVLVALGAGESKTQDLRVR